MAGVNTVWTLIDDEISIRKDYDFIQGRSLQS
jgi:hypothetical protein